MCEVVRWCFVALLVVPERVFGVFGVFENTLGNTACLGTLVFGNACAGTRMRLCTSVPECLCVSVRACVYACLHVRMSARMGFRFRAVFGLCSGRARALF